MMKYFRKHTKHLLAFFMALLLVVWLLEGTLNKASDEERGRGSAAWGQVFGKKITANQVAFAQQNAEIMEALGISWSQFWGRNELREPLELREWFMLEADARHRGLHVPADVITKMRQSRQQAIDAVRNRLKVSPEEIDQALESYLLVQAALFADMQGIKLSDADVQDFVRGMSEKAKVKLAVFSADQFKDPSYQPTDEQLREQYEKYKDEDPGAGEGGFGYRLPEQTQIEFIQIKVDELGKQQNINDEEAYEYWKQNMRPTATQPGSQPTTSPSKPYLTFGEARDLVHKKMRSEKAKKEALRIGTELAKYLNQPVSSAPATQPGTETQPAIDATQYTRAMDLFRQKAGDALSYQRSSFEDRDGLRVLGAVATAAALKGTQEQINLIDAVFLVPGLEATPEDRPTQARWFHKLGDTIQEPFVDTRGNVYVFRTLAAKPKRQPESWEAVKDQLVRDLRLHRGAQLAEQQAKLLAERAKQVGLDQAVRDTPGLTDKLAPVPATLPGQPTPPPQQAVKTPPPFARKQFGYGGLMPSFVQEVGPDGGEFVDMVFSMGGKTATQPSRVEVYSAQDQGRWIVVELVEIVPVIQQEFERGREMAKALMMRERSMSFVAGWLDRDSIRARVSYKPEHPEDDKPRSRAGA